MPWEVTGLAAIGLGIYGFGWWRGAYKAALATAQGIADAVKAMSEDEVLAWRELLRKGDGVDG